MPSFYSGNFKVFKSALGQYIPNRPPKHLITSTYCFPEILLINMRCITVAEFGGPEVLKYVTDAAVPKPGAKQVFSPLIFGGNKRSYVLK